jgi:hypothetical protein
MDGSIKMIFMLYQQTRNIKQRREEFAQSVAQKHPELSLEEAARQGKEQADAPLELDLDLAEVRRSVHKRKVQVDSSDEGDSRKKKTKRKS